jgi:hypothetical protein
MMASINQPRHNFGADLPDLRDFVKESPIVLVNVDELVDYPRPIISNIVYIGGLGINTDNEKQELLVKIFKIKLVNLF